MVSDLLVQSILPFWNYVNSASVREWSVVLAELVVAWVIYRELRLNRNAAFLEKATRFEANEDRRKIYQACFNSPVVCSTVDEASKSFDEYASTNRDLRQACEKQIALFNELGLVYRREFWLFRDRLVTVLPHAAIYLWIFCRPYITRRRRDTGWWYAQPLIEFTLESVKYVLKFNHPLYLRDENSSTKRQLVISVGDLQNICAELKSELRRVG